MTICNPTLEEFLRCARKEFHFLIAEFAFQEQALPGQRDVNEYQVRYVNAATLVKVEGINWGYGVNTLLEPRRQPIFRREISFPLWLIVKLRRPELYDTLVPGDQLDQLAAHANALRECATDVLRGDFNVRAQVERLMKQQLSTGPSELEEWLCSKAMDCANEAFRSKDYRKVVALLGPYEKRLSPAQRLKLEYAKKKSIGDGNAFEPLDGP